MNQLKCMKWAVAAAMAMMAVGVARATDATVAGDASVSSAHPSTNYGRLSNLRVGSGSTTLIQFDLSSLPAGTTASQIGNATLKLYINRVDSSGSVSVLPVTSAWSEGTVTFNTIPSFGSALASFTPTSDEQFVVIDVTSLVQAWVTTPASNFGIGLKSSTAAVDFDSKENDETSHAAHLDITVVSQGPVGPMGPIGPQGPTGSTGAQGPAGPAGAPGSQGPPVSFKNAWSSSTIYAIGDAVSQNGSSYIALAPNLNVDPATDVAGSGTTWALLAGVGAAGATGATGPQGPAGLMGPIGPQGPTGVTGPQGPAGPTGATGATGATGPQGPAGATGATGATGPQGPPLSFKNAWNSSTSYAIGDAVSESGSSYIALTANSNVDPATDVAGSGTNWALLAKIGSTGSSGTVSVGATTTGAFGTSALVTNTGTPSAAILNFTIPQGVPGPAGPTGPTGATGPTGPTGATGSVSLTSFEWNALFNNGGYSGSPLFFSPTGTTSNNGATSISFNSNNEMAVPLACAVTSLDVGVITTTSGSGSSDSATFTFYHNGVATSMRCTATVGVAVGSKGSCSTTSNGFTVAAGDTLSIQLSETNFNPVYQYGTNLKCQ